MDRLIEGVLLIGPLLGLAYARFVGRWTWRRAWRCTVVGGYLTGLPLSALVWLLGEKVPGDPPLAWVDHIETLAVVLGEPLALASVVVAVALALAWLAAAARRRIDARAA